MDKQKLHLLQHLHYNCQLLLQQSESLLEASSFTSSETGSSFSSGEMELQHSKNLRITSSVNSISVHCNELLGLCRDLRQLFLTVDDESTTKQKLQSRSDHENNHSLFDLDSTIRQLESILGSNEL
ncbi:hypothetical protein GEMRC1_008623 [Eukaryota sp. GEM-RC1]